MTLEQVSYLSQTIAALAVVVSLIYAALQFRTYAETARDARFIAAQSDLQDFRKILATDVDCARIYRDGLADITKLASTDQWRFGAMMQMLVTNADYTHSFQDVYRGGTDQAFTVILRRPGFRQWWPQGRTFFAPTTVALVDGLLAEAEAAAIRADATGR
jgi:hypothetical protein